MAQEESTRETTSRQPPGRIAGLATATVLFLASAAWFSLSAPLTLEWIDEGQIVYPIWRSAQGAIPYRDFGHAYWPALFATNGLLMRMFGEDLAVVRAGLVVLKAAIALCTYRLARHLSRFWIALGAWAFLLAVWGAPVWIFNTPYANHYALACGLAMSLVLLGTPGRSAGRPFLAGMLAGVAATFKHTTGAFVALAGLAIVASGLRLRPAQMVIRHLGIAIPGAVVVLYTELAPASWTTALLVAPVLTALIRLAVEAPLGSTDARDLAAFAAGAAVPVLVCLGMAAWLGILPSLITETLVGLGEHMSWTVALPGPRAIPAVAVVTMAAVLAAPETWRHARGVQATCWIALAVCGVTWLWNDGGGFVALLWMPLATTTLAVAAWLGGATQGVDTRGRAFRLSVVFAAFMLLTLSPGADVPHALMVLPAVLPLAAYLADRLVGPPGAFLPRRFLAAAFVVLLAVRTVSPMVAELWRARAAWTRGEPRFTRATGIWQPGPEYADAANLVDRLEVLLPPGAPLVLLPSEQMIYFLAGRPSAIERDEFALYLLATAIIPPAAASAVVDEQALVSRLRTMRPLVVLRDTDTMLDRLRLALPALARFLATQCERGERIGPYTLCRVTLANATHD